MASRKNTIRVKVTQVPDVDLQKGRQQGHHTGKLAWKSNFKILDTQPGPGQKGQHPRSGEAWGSTPGELRGHPGGKKGQFKSGQRGTARGRNAPKARKSR